MVNPLECPRCTKEMRSLGGYPQCITCGYEDYATKIVEESISSPEALRGNLYIAHYRGLTLVNKDVVIKIKLENVVSNKDSEPKLIPEGYKALTSELLKEEDDLHLDIRNISFRFLFGKLARKRPSSIKKFEDDQGTIEGKRDSHKVKEVNFHNDFLKQGIHEDVLTQSITKFIKVYERLEEDLVNQEFLLGEEVSVLDIAWFIYTHRLTLAGYDFKKRHRAVYNWYLNLLGKEAFKKEIEEPFILKAVRSSIRLKDIVSGSTLKHLSS